MDCRNLGPMRRNRSLPDWRSVVRWKAPRKGAGSRNQNPDQSRQIKSHVYRRRLARSRSLSRRYESVSHGSCFTIAEPDETSASAGSCFDRSVAFRSGPPRTLRPHTGPERFKFRSEVP